MNILKKLFGISGKENENTSIDEYLEKINSLSKSALLLSKSNNSSINQIGGLPRLPLEIDWPIWNGVSLSFLCQINLTTLSSDFNFNLPKQGALFFFYDVDQSTWGFDPNDIGSWRVIYTEENIENITPRDLPKDLVKHGFFKHKDIVIEKIKTFPDWQDDRINDLGLNDPQIDKYYDFIESAFDNGPKHQLFGYQAPVQGDDMDLECQLVSNGLYCGDTTGYEHPKRKQLELEKQDWILLLQLDTDDDCEMMWGDSGKIYFWIRKQDLEAYNFDKCWMILQCS
jgi:uncharacterized protein YwqG